MALTYGFYNSYAGDRKYDAMQVSELFDGLVSDGIIPNIGQLFAVTAGGGMTVNVGTGRAWFFHSWTKNDSIMTLDIPVSDISRPRTDAVVLEINRDEAVRANSIFILTGTPSVNAIKPTLTNTDKICQVPLAYITVKAGAEEIKAENIENMVGRSPTVFAKGLLETASLDTLWSQWEGEFDTWFENIKMQLSTDTVTNLQRQIDALNTNKVNVSDKASNSVAISGTSTTKWMTPAATKAAIDSNSSKLILSDGTYVLKRSYGVVPSVIAKQVLGSGTNARTIIDCGNFYVYYNLDAIYSVNKKTGAVKGLASLYDQLVTNLGPSGHPDKILAQNSETYKLAVIKVSGTGTISTYSTSAFTFSDRLSTVIFGKDHVLVKNYLKGTPFYAITVPTLSVSDVTSICDASFTYGKGFVGDYFIGITDIAASPSVTIRYMNLSNGSSGTNTCAFSGTPFSTDIVGTMKMNWVAVYGNDNTSGYLHGSYATASGSKSLTIRSPSSVTSNGYAAPNNLGTGQLFPSFNYAGQYVYAIKDKGIYKLSANGFTSFSIHAEGYPAAFLKDNVIFRPQENNSYSTSYWALNISTGVITPLLSLVPNYFIGSLNYYATAISSSDNYCGVNLYQSASGFDASNLFIYDLDSFDTPVVAIKS